MNSRNLETIQDIHREKESLSRPERDLPEDLSARVKECLDRQEVGDAELFAILFKDRFVYDSDAKKWYAWRGHWWEEERHGEAHRALENYVAGEYLRAAATANQAGNQALAKQYGDRARALWSKRRVDAVLSEAERVPEMNVRGDVWDQQSMLLPVANGVIDLRTGRLIEGRPSLYMRKHSPSNYRGIGEYDPAWEKFISEFCEGIVMVLGGDHEQMIGFIRRLFGYFITGNVDDKILPIMWGDHGYNGRTTLQETLKVVLGEDFTYGVSADVLMVSKHEQSGPQPYLYDLQGKRMVYAIESKEGQIIDSGVVKQLSGMDSFRTHTKYSLPITVNPTYKIALLTNKKPHIDVEDDSLWRRILLIPFGISYVDKPEKPWERQRISNLGENLRKGAPGILAWLVRGCLEWQAQGLNPPREILAATSEYRNEEDTLKEFKEECLEENPSGWMTITEAYKLYEEWLGKGRGMGRTTFSKRMQKWYPKKKSGSKGWYLEGVRARNKPLGAIQ